MQGNVDGGRRFAEFDSWMQGIYAYQMTQDAHLEAIKVAMQRIHWDWAGGIIKKRLVT